MKAHNSEITNEIKHQGISTPDFTPLHPGYSLNKNKKNVQIYNQQIYSGVPC